MENTTKVLIKITEASRIIGVSVDTLRRWDEIGKFKSFRTSPRGYRYYTKADIDNFIRKVKQNGA